MTDEAISAWAAYADELEQDNVAAIRLLKQLEAENRPDRQQDLHTAGRHMAESGIYPAVHL